MECVSQKWLFFSNEINFCCNEINFFLFKLLFRTKVSQNSFNFNLRQTLNFSVTPYFEKILCSVARRFICEINLHQYLQTLFYTIVIVVVTVT